MRTTGIWTAVAVLAIGVGHVHAGMLTIAGTGAFDQTLGTLNSVTVAFDPPAVSTEIDGVHRHAVDPDRFAVPFGPGTVIDFDRIHIQEPQTEHFVTVADFVWNGLLINPSDVMTTDGTPSHFHTLDFGEVVVDAQGFLDLPETGTSFSSGHQHTVDVPVFEATFTGADLSVFLDPASLPDPLVNMNGDFSSGLIVNDLNFNHGHAIGGFHTAQLGNGDLVEIEIPLTISTLAGTHSHSVPHVPEFSVLSTTFHYTPAAVPEPSSLALLGTGSFAVLLGAVRRRRKRKSHQS